VADALFFVAFTVTGFALVAYFGWWTGSSGEGSFPDYFMRYTMPHRGKLLMVAVAAWAAWLLWRLVL
jgi:phosphotransferase system  glucose/maltose/N-acetylglucosamine-specific IIC component